MFIDGISAGIGLLFLSLLFLSPAEHKPSKLVGGIIVLLCWLVCGSHLLDQGPLLTRLYIASVPVVFFLLLPMIYGYQQLLAAYGSQPPLAMRSIHGVPVALACLLSLSIGLMPAEDFNSMFFSDAEPLSTWVNINSLVFAILLLVWAVLSLFYLTRIVISTKAYHRRLSNEFADHEGKRLDWLVAFTGLLVAIWFYALVALGLSSDDSSSVIHDTLLSLMVLILIGMFSIQSLNRRPVFINAEPEPDPDPEPKGDSEQKYSNSSIDEVRLKRIASKVERKVMDEMNYLNPDIDASTLASELGISVHYLSQVLSQQMQTTFYSYINDARIEAAKDVLKSTDKTVLEIALAVGYNTRSSFYNAFKKRTGMTPKKFRASMALDSVG